ncbi:MAG: molecular chaperone HtpG [Rhodospirillales bacterium]|jgi:molecular chaperone HtpG
MTEERLQFQSDVARLLEIVAHALYSEKEVFLRELVSNASDACDKLRYAALTDDGLMADGVPLEIRLLADTEARTLTVADTGVGMNREDLVENLGTIARSGTARFLEQLSGDARKDLSLIGQFGVGFYAAFMVADEVEVTTRRAGEAQGWRWRSDGKGGFTIAEAADVVRGTRVTLHLKPGEDEFLDERRLGAIVRKYSDHIPLPIRFGDGGDATTLNRASALWTRSKSEVTAEEYKEFYHHVGHAFDDPWLTVHWRAEGKLEYTALLFVPTLRPFDLFDPRRRPAVKLYVRRVFITDEAEGLLPAYLRFLRGVVDSEDLPLNVSREMLQQNPMLARMKSGLARRVLQDLVRKADDPESGYPAFWEAFGAVLKEGLYEDNEHRDLLLRAARFRSTAADGLASLEDYVGRMKEGQEAIFTITGDDPDALLRSPQLEGYRAKGVEVLLLTDPVDEFWLPAVASYKDKPFKSVTRGGADLSAIKAAEAAEANAEAKPAVADTGPLVALLKLSLGDAVKDVRPSERLTDSAVCLVADEGDMDMHLERLLKQHKQLDRTARRILEINPAHPLVRALAERAGAPGATDDLADAAWLLLDQARIVEGEPLPDPSAFARRLATLMAKGLSAAG